MKKVHLLYAVSFLAAFLLFQIELIISKVLLPVFGGSYLVWGACMVFFQCVLLLGYAFSHVAIQIRGFARYRTIHLVLLALPLLVFPGRPLEGMHEPGNLFMVADIFLKLLTTIGPVFFALTTISVLSQSWLSSSQLPERKNPYVLYAVSNVGSFLALLTYPFFVEVFLDVGTQLLVWRIAYGLFLFLYVITHFLITVDDARPKEKFSLGALCRLRLGLGEKIAERPRWFILSAAGTVLFLSVTNVMTFEVSPSPLLWIIPLGLYLLSFVLVFRDKPLIPKWMIDQPEIMLGAFVLISFLGQGTYLPFIVLMAANFALLFAACLYCQHELYQTRPRHSDGLTTFYVIIAFGSVLGGFFVSWVSPVIFSSVSTDLFLGFILVAFAARARAGQERIGFYQIGVVFAWLLVLLIWPLVFSQYDLLGLCFLILVFWFVFRSFQNRAAGLALALGVLIILFPMVEIFWGQPFKALAHKRNYYGTLKVASFDGKLFFFSGTTIHGFQYFDPARRRQGTAYYHDETPIAKLLKSPAFNFHHVGLVGLGSGVLAVYGKSGQSMDFFELDPDVYQIADKFFSFLRDSKAAIKYYFGDARIQLRAVDQRYELLVIDAFSSDTIPVHLLTAEAIREYRSHLVPDGILVMHVTNRSLDLIPMIYAIGKSVGSTTLVDYNASDGADRFGSTWVAMTWDETQSQILKSQLEWEEAGVEYSVKEAQPWTDRYSSILMVIDWPKLLDRLRSFRVFR